MATAVRQWAVSIAVSGAVLTGLLFPAPTYAFSVCDGLGWLLRPLGLCQQTVVVIPPVAAPAPVIINEAPAPAPIVAGATTTIVTESIPAASTPQTGWQRFAAQTTALLSEIIARLDGEGTRGDAPPPRDRIGNELVEVSLLYDQADELFEKIRTKSVGISESFDTDSLEVSGDATLATTTIAELTIEDTIAFNDATPPTTTNLLYRQGAELFWNGSAVTGSTTGAWTVAGSDVYRLTGNVGVGTSTPASTLDVWGDVRVGTSSTPTLFVDAATDRVGIGTDSPATGFGLTVNEQSYLRQGLNIDNNWSIRWQGSEALVGSIVTGLFQVTPHSNWDTVTFDTQAIERMRITDNGNVGIATTTPTNLLTVAGTLGAATLCDEYGGNCASVTALTSGTSPWSQNGSDIYYTAGSIGIGTTSPLAETMLQVAQTSQ
jgi:hypothetical protein